MQSKSTNDRKPYTRVVITIGLLVIAIFSTRSCIMSEDGSDYPPKQGMIASIFSAVGEAFAEATADFVRNERAGRMATREYSERATSEPGAVVLDLGDDKGINVRRYEGSDQAFVDDTRTGSSTSWQYTLKRVNNLPPGQDGSIQLTFYKRPTRGVQPIPYYVEGRIAKGVGAIYTSAVLTIELVHKRTFFPYSEAFDAGQEPMTREAAMFNAAWMSMRGGPAMMTVIDRRAALQVEHKRLAALERRDRPILFPTRNQDGILAQRPIVMDEHTMLAEPDSTVLADPERKTVTSPRDGLTLTIVRTPDRDYFSYDAIVQDRAGRKVASVEFAVEQAWRPDVGETIYILINRVTTVETSYSARPVTLTQAQMPLAALARLLNGVKPLGYRANKGYAILRDIRDNPVQRQF